MVPELGQLTLILSFCLCVILGTLPLIGAGTGNRLWIGLARPLTAGVFVFLTMSLVILGYSFVIDDFSVSFVAQHSNSLLPIQYKITAVWGGHEGSFLFWTWMLSGWMLSVAIFSKAMPDDFVARVLGVMGLIGAGYTLFMIMTSNPFDRILPLSPPDGADLNSALQDFGFIIHPPSLYMGYVGFSVVFAFAIAALLSGRLDSAWARWSRPWANAAWAILTIGIALGSWWAYYELGWGGWWAWDPVENPPMINWLLGTALIHSLAATEKRGVFKSWTVLLAIMAFAASLLGTFITRSGLLTSVHAFASDPTRGIYILGFLGLVVGGSLLLFALRAPLMKSEFGFAAISREVFLLANNIILVVASAAILLGTLYPMVYQAVSGGELISVGPPYFNMIFVPLMAILVLFLALGSISRWKKTSVQYLRKQLGIVAIASVLLGVVLPLVVTFEFNFGASIATMLGLWIILGIVQDIRIKISNKASTLSGLKSLATSYIGMQIAHFGFAMIMLGASLTSIYSVEKSVLLSAGETVDLGAYDFVFQGTEPIQGPNFVGDLATFQVMKNDQYQRDLHPEKRIYTQSGSPSTEMAIDAGFWRDLFITLGEPRESGAWSMTIYIKPFVRWVWLGAILMALGGVVAVTDKRYRRLKVRTLAGEAAEQAGGSGSSGKSDEGLRPVSN
ncbi:MAG: heme lyase CcmF/NrfE family subunit [Gammaproteobacteria bacterium]|nr:heme lyase CcmF/NrfE family subunit [Gammaproteobacteria bacterium]